MKMRTVLCAGTRWPAEAGARDYQVMYEGNVDPERWEELKRGGAPGELDEAQMQEESASEKAEETAGGKGGNGRGTAGSGGETAETKEVQATGISGKSDQDFADCGGNRGYLLFWRTFSACAALDLPEIAGMACAEPVKERLAAGGKIGFAF